MENVDVIKPQPRTLDRVHGEYANLTAADKEARAREKLADHIRAGQRSALQALQRIQDEVPVDRVVSGPAMSVRPQGGVLFSLRAGENAIGTLNDHSLAQLAARVGMPMKFANEVRGKTAGGVAWGDELVAHNLNQLLAHVGERMLVREVNGTVRGVLGRSYRTDDSRPALDALLTVAQEANAVIAQADVTETRTSVKVMVNEPVELFPGEWAVFGLDYRNSDYGAGAREVCGWILRLLCLNGAVTTANYRRVHLGGHLGDETDYSNRTRKLNAEFTASATRDMARALLGPQAVRKMVDQVRAANAAQLDADAAVASIRKSVNKAEEKAIVDKFNSPDVELLPPGNTKWRFSNAISWLAGQVADADRKLDLQKLAGSFVEAA